jgi:hypothetical protein
MTWVRSGRWWEFVEKGRKKKDYGGNLFSKGRRSGT